MMQRDEAHRSDQELLLAADGELPKPDAKRVEDHWTGCWTCRARMGDLGSTIADFVRVRQQLIPPLPPAEGSRALLRLRMAELAESSRLTLWERVATNLPEYSSGLAWSAAVGVLLIGFIVWHSLRPASDGGVRTAGFMVRSVPDPQLTPGATLPVTKADVCTAGVVEAVRIVPVDVARKVFAAYGVETPEPRAYEVDYLITPALGGSDNIRNFWPQPYKNTIWNAHIKDALEDHLQDLVCAGQVELVAAQHEIAADWISAYKKYFHTETPLPEHTSFLKDRPWEKPFNQLV
jgi:anti-sigma factor RsiW